LKPEAADDAPQFWTLGGGSFFRFPEMIFKIAKLPRVDAGIGFSSCGTGDD
jgi:hypothetical protein